MVKDRQLFSDSRWSSQVVARVTWKHGPESNSALRRSPVVRSDEYQFAIEDLHDLAAIAERTADDASVQPSAEAVKMAESVVHRVAGAYPAPEVTVRETGTVLLLWHDGTGFISIEVGATHFGLVSSRSGYPSIRINGSNDDLMNEIPRAAVENKRLSNYLGVRTARVERSPRSLPANGATSALTV